MILVSCSQEEIIQDKSQGDGLALEFRAGMGTRVNPNLDYSKGAPATFYATGYIGNHKANEAGEVPKPYFEDETFTKDTDVTYTSSNNVKWPDTGETMEFFAYAPSLEEIRKAAITQLNPNHEHYNDLKGNYESSIDFFNVCSTNSNNYDPVAGSQTFDGVGLVGGYKLGRFYVATDISKQIDFITAHVSANIPKKDQENTGVELTFKHQLSNIELRAFSGNSTYNIEVAGVRLGRPFTGNAIFNFCDKDGNVSNEEGGMWGISKNPQRLAVEYIFGEGDKIIRMGSYVENAIPVSTHNTPALATSIMGKGGNAMVLPTKNAAWKGTDNPWIAPKYADNPAKKAKAWNPETEGDMYFSVLVRVTMKDSGTQIYPYQNNTNMNVVELYKKADSNEVIGNANNFVNPPANSVKYQFGWVCVPVDVNWERGYKYIYTLDFTDGVGIQDPEDHNPGVPIIGSGIKFTVSIDSWKDGNGNGEDHKVPSE